MIKEICTQHVILRRNHVLRRTGLSRSTIYLLIKKGDFPKPIHLGPRAVGWLENEINEWLEKKVSNRDKNPNASCSHGAV
ncbi:MAG: AlpA family transcriptional regulator [Bacteroidetes bacterium]|nr:AlpA family transcriptional regulator [Bacteroidota bacterium]